GESEWFADEFGQFNDLCESQGWRCAVLGARRDRLDIYEAYGLRTLYLGDEAIIDAQEFTLDGRKMRPVRQAANRTINHGITCEVHREGTLEPTLRRGRPRPAPPAPAPQAAPGVSLAPPRALDKGDPPERATARRVAHGHAVAR